MHGDGAVCESFPDDGRGVHRPALLSLVEERLLFGELFEIISLAARASSSGSWLPLLTMTPSPEASGLGATMDEGSVGGLFRSFGGAGSVDVTDSVWSPERGDLVRVA